MEHLELKPDLFGDPAQLLALDEAALDHAEGGGSELIWFWESRSPWVVVGLGQSVAVEVDVETCLKDGVAILRRCSGGGAVVQGPGCLNYAVTLKLEHEPALAAVTSTNQWIMSRVRTAIQRATTAEIAVQGHTDLAFNDGTAWRKFSGNAQRRRRSALLFHGTVLYGHELSHIGRYLRHPSAEPDYREKRSHAEFVSNINLSAARIVEELLASWGPESTSRDFPWASVGRLAMSRYRSRDWNFKR